MKYSDLKSAAETEGTETALKFRKTAQKAILGVTGFVALLILTVIVSIAVRSVPERPSVQQAQQQVKQGCPSYSSKETHRCVVTESPIILSTEERTVAGEFEFCYLKPEHAVLVTKKLGVNTFEFKSVGDAFQIRYKMVRRDALVNGGCPSVL